MYHQMVVYYSHYQFYNTNHGIMVKAETRDRKVYGLKFCLDGLLVDYRQTSLVARSRGLRNKYGTPCNIQQAKQFELEKAARV